MSSRFLASYPLRSRVVLGLLAGGFVLLAGAAAVDYRRNAEGSFLGALNPLGDPTLTVDRLLEKGAKGNLSRSVKLQGEVVVRSPLLNGVVYQLKDPTGTIWIQSQDSDIEVGQVLTVQGQPVYKEVLLDGLDFGTFYLEESQRMVANTN